MNVFNIILIVILAGFALYGLFFGLIHTFGVLLGTVVGAYAAGAYYEPVAQWFNHSFGGSINVTRAIAFLLVFVVINRLVGLLFIVLEKVFQIAAIIPFVTSLNRILGAAFGLLEGALVIGVTLYVVVRFPFEPVARLITASPLAQFLLGIARILIPLLPETLRTSLGIPR